MTKKTKKLNLNTVTVRELRTRLQDDQLKNVDGGRVSVPPPDSSKDGDGNGIC